MALFFSPVTRSKSDQAYHARNKLVFTAPLNLPTYTFKFLHKSRDLLEHALLFGQVLRV